MNKRNIQLSEPQIKEIGDVVVFRIAELQFLLEQTDKDLRTDRVRELNAQIEMLNDVLNALIKMN